MVRKRRSDVILFVIIVVAIIDAVLIAWLRVRYLREHGYDLSPPRRVACVGDSAPDS